MPTATKEKETKEKKPAQPKIDPDLVSKAVIERLGKPKDLAWVDSVHLWENHFRVNVWCGDPPRILHSYFVRFGDEGIVDAAPDIDKKY